MPEIKETRSADAMKLVEESVSRIHEMERRLQNVQANLANLANMAGFSPASSGAPQLAPYGIHERAYGAPPLGWASSSLPIGFVGANPPTLGPSGMGSYGRPQPFPQAPATFAASAFPNTENWTTTRDIEKLPPTPRVPETNVVDAGETFLIQFELPGVKKDDVEILAGERSITVNASARFDLGEGTLLVGEALPVIYRRTVALPQACNVNQTKASLKDGFLTLKVPKREPSEGPRRLDVAYG